VNAPTSRTWREECDHEMTRSVSTPASAIFDPADDGYEENGFAVAGSSVDGENVSVGSFRRAVVVEEVTRV